MNVINLIDEDGVVVQVDKEQCYPEGANGTIVCLIKKYTYFVGRKTDDQVTHYFNDDGCLQEIDE